VIRAEKSFFEAEKLLVGRLAVVEDIGRLAPEIDLDAPQHERKGVLKKSVIILEGNFAGVLVDLDDVGFVRVSINAGGTEDVDAQNGWKLRE
jgi:hypothetical protein